MKSIKSITFLSAVLSCLFFIQFDVLKAQSCLPGGAYFTSQDQINNFSAANPGCQVIEGAVNITGQDILNLQGLSGIREIQGDMFISQTVQLTSLEGLDQLIRIRGAVRIQNNTGLISFEGLSNLKAIEGDYFYISDSPLSQNLEGFEELDSIGGIVHIVDMPGLKSLKGWENVSFIGDRLSIFRCDSLLSLDGLEALSEVGALDITDNLVLNSVRALDHPVQINAQMVFDNNPELSECKVEAICDHLIDPPSFIIFSNNGDGCSDKAQLELECVSNRIYENLSSAIKVFPNPVNEFLILDIPVNTRIEWIQIYNVQGKTVNIQLYQNRIEMAGLSPGLYFGKVILNEKLHHFSIVKN